MAKEARFFPEIVALLKTLIATPSFSNEEEKAADIWFQWLKDHGAGDVRRFHNNIFALSSPFDSSKPVVLLNSHLDTVRPSSSYTRDPFSPIVSDGKLYGLGSNDAGGAGVCLGATFLKFQDVSGLPFNLLLAISASEEKMGEYGMRALLPHFKELGIFPDMAVVGEPTSCQAAFAERGLVVCDVEVEGLAGHAARNEGINAIYRAVDDIGKIRKITWPHESSVLGPIKVSVTMIEAGSQHNVVPASCKYVADIRTTDALSNEDTVAYLESATEWSRFSPRSTRIRASVLDAGHPLYRAACESGMKLFVSPTTSDMANMSEFPSIKIGPGDSARSHTADEFIFLDDLREGLASYETYLNKLITLLTPIQS